MIRDELLIHNQFRESLERYRDYDPQLKRLKKEPFEYVSKLLKEKSFHKSGVYLITGGRQVGKTTFLKQFILDLLTVKNVPPASILFLNGELIDDHHQLRRIVQDFVREDLFQYLFIDEVNYIAGWDKAIKFLADAGLFETTSVMLTGSDSCILREAMKRFAGRRGREDQVDYIFDPLSYKDFVVLKDASLKDVCEELEETPYLQKSPLFEKSFAQLQTYFKEYLIHGGYLPAISDYWKEGTISRATFNTYGQWIVGDILKHNKSEVYLLEVLGGIVKRYGSQVSWGALSKDLSIDHHKTVSDYCEILSMMHVLNIVPAIIEHKLVAAPKKAKKLYFRDPFIFHAVQCLIQADFDPKSYLDTVEQRLDLLQMIEGVLLDYCQRFNPTFYIKGSKGEVDAAIVVKKSFEPIELKWTQQLRQEDLKQISTYDRGYILTPQESSYLKGDQTVLSLIRFMLS